MSEAFESILSGLEELSIILNNPSYKKAADLARGEMLKESSWENNNTLKERVKCKSDLQKNNIRN